MTLIAFEPNGHRYTVMLPTGQVVTPPSVTQILHSIYPRREHPEVLARSAQLGRDVHRGVELLLADKLEPSSVDDYVAPYLEALKVFLFSCDFRVTHCEPEDLAVFSLRYGYAGMLDLRGTMMGALGRRKPWQLDIKTGVESPLHALQTAGYEGAWSEMTGEPWALRGALYLRPTGKFMLRPHTSSSDHPRFMAALTCSRFKLEHDL
jgi:hypothetical protein